MGSQLSDFTSILIKPHQEKNYFTHFIRDEIESHRGEVTWTHTRAQSTHTLYNLNPGLSKTPKSDHNCIPQCIKYFIFKVYMYVYLTYVFIKYLVDMCAHAKL